MTANPELAFHILRYSAQQLAEDDLKALLEFGFSIEEIQAIEALTLKQLNHLSQLNGHFLDVSVNHQRFARALKHIHREAEGEALQDEMIRLRAPTAMMRALFGMTPLQYANRRKLLGLSGVGVGRPALPSEDTERMIWQAWQQQAQLSDAERYLATARVTQLPLSVVWTVVHAWETDSPPRCTDRPPAADSEVAVPSDADGISVLTG